MKEDVEAWKQGLPLAVKADTKLKLGQVSSEFQGPGIQGRNLAVPDNGEPHHPPPQKAVPIKMIMGHLGMFACIQAAATSEYMHFFFLFGSIWYVPPRQPVPSTIHAEFHGSLRGTAQLDIDGGNACCKPG